MASGNTGLNKEEVGMKRMKIIGVSLVIVGVFCGSAAAQEKGFGIGVILGDPTGINVKLCLTKKNAVSLAAGYDMRGDGYLNFHADYLYHTKYFASSKAVKIPFFFGVGGRLVLEDDEGDDEGDNMVGIRIPIGVDFMIRKAPLDVFIEVVPIMNVIPETDFDIEAGVGIRFFIG